MRYDVKKFLFAGLEEERDRFFKQAQEAGIIHFIDAKAARAKEASPEVQTLARAIKILRGLPVVEQEEIDDFDAAGKIAHQIVSLRENLDALEEEERMTRLELSRIEVFGDFSIEDIRYIEQHAERKIQFYCAKRERIDKEALPDEVIFVGTEQKLDYFFAINKEPTQYPDMIEMEIDRSWGELDQRYCEVKQEIQSLEQTLKTYAKYKLLLHQALIARMNEYHLEEAKHFVDFPLKEKPLFVVQGWVPEHKRGALDELVKEMNVYVEQIGVDENEAIPTYLENYGASRIGEDLVHIYDTPSPTDKDPSLWVLVFFALFFSIIIGDAGYGLVLLLIAIYVRFRHGGLKSLKKRVLNLVTILAFACIAWGLLTTSFFGITFAPDSPIRKVSLISWLVEKKAEYHLERKDEVYQEWIKHFPELQGVQDPKEFLTKASTVDHLGRASYDAYQKFADNILMELALLIGVIHILFSMGRYLSRNWSYIGWIIFIIGGYLYIPSFLEATTIAQFAFGIDQDIAAEDGLYMIYGGALIAILIALFRDKMLGLLEATLVIQIFSDILSYLRLYALALSGSLLTMATTDLAAAVPLIFGIIILVIGHSLNLALAIMGGVIHGLRLNFLEWYHYSFEGGGKLFKPLHRQEIE